MIEHESLKACYCDSLVQGYSCVADEGAVLRSEYYCKKSKNITTAKPDEALADAARALVEKALETAELCETANRLVASLQRQMTPSEENAFDLGYQRCFTEIKAALDAHNVQSAALDAGAQAAPSSDSARCRCGHDRYDHTDTICRKLTCKCETFAEAD